jgi:4-amino-4-deoxy-L-arabinose transferase-like glycosyltransferase
VKTLTFRLHENLRADDERGAGVRAHRKRHAKSQTKHRKQRRALGPGLSSDRCAIERLSMASEVGGESFAWYEQRLGGSLCAAVLLLAMALVLFVNLAEEPIRRTSEKRCLSVVSAMVRSGDWMIPRVEGVARLQKPPLLYWAGAATATLLHDVGPIALRLPSAIATLALLGVVMAWAASLGGIGRGLAAGALLVGMYQLTASGRRGDAEMLLAFFCTATLFAFDRVHVTRRRALLPVFGALAGLALLSKSTAVFVVVALPVLVSLALEGELRRLRDPGVLGACALALAIGFAWYVAIVVLLPGALAALWQDLVLPLGAGSSLGVGAKHYNPIWYFLAVLPVRAAPASVLLPVVLWRLWTTRLYRDDPRMRFAALCFVAPFVAFSLLPQKQQHYTLVMLPSLAIVSAESVRALAPRARAWLARGFGVPFALAGIAATALLALYFHWIEARPLAGILAASVFVGGLFALALVSALRGRIAGLALAAVPAFLLVLALHRGVAVVRAEQIEKGGMGSLSLDERERLYRVAREQPWFVQVFQLARESDGSG